MQDCKNHTKNGVQLKLIVIVFTVFCNIICGGQVLQFGSCDDVETMKYFEIDKFLGKWYEIERFPTWYEENGECAFKTIQQCGKHIEIQHGFVRDGIQFILHVNSSYSSGDDAVFEVGQSEIDPIGISLSVISTDYENYAVVYGCKENPTLGIKYILAWILSRDTTLSADLLNRTYEVLNTLPNASAVYLEPVTQNHENCTYLWTAHVNPS